MPEVSWSMLLRDQPAAHLVVGIMPPNGPPQVRLRVALLARLATSLRLAGFYALNDVRDGDGNLIQCALEHLEDARKVVDAVGANSLGPQEPWTSRFGFSFDEAKFEELRQKLRTRGA